ncbi:MAG: ImmA/IrrE family metallo-endopeptidase [Proteobacteria bacterium]|nr:ImmA/IrrE family metallo-endopeptidase [Pseudomonadota bacterium]
MPEKKTSLQFLGRNIRYLRRQRGWTIARLANEAGIAEIPLGRIERGENAPSAIALYGLSKSLNVSIDAFFAKELKDFISKQIASSEEPFVQTEPFKALSPKIMQMAREMMDAVCSLEDICGAQKHASLPLNISFDPSREGIENLSVMARNYMGIGDSVVFDYIELFESMGLRVVFVPFPKETESIAFYDLKNQNAFFFLKTKMNPERQLFQLMYQLGRIFMLCQTNRTGKNTFPDAGNDLSGEGSQKPLTMHRAARYFAALVLMPERTVRVTVNQLGIVNNNWSYELLLRIKHRFGVSAEAFLFRLKELFLIDMSVHDRLRGKINKYYNINNYSEPDSTRRILTSNGRIWDLVITAKTYADVEDEVRRIENTLVKWSIKKV